MDIGGNMWIKSLFLSNFQQHKELTINFSPNVNYIVGPSGCGKSTILRAISFILWGEPHSDSIRKDGEKITSVKVTLHNDIEVTRIKSASINRMIVKIGDKEKTYDSIGTGIPEEVKAIFGVSYFTVDKEDLNLNFAEQISLPFLYDKPASFRHKLFNKLTGADLIDSLLQLFNKSILQIGRDIKVNQEFIKNNQPKLDAVTLQHTEKTTLYGNVKQLYDSITTRFIAHKGLNDVKNRLELTLNSFLSVKSALEGVKIASDATLKALKAKIDIYTSLCAYQPIITNINKDLRDVNVRLPNIKIVSQELVDKIKDKSEHHFSLEDIKGAYEDNEETIHRVTQEMDSIKMVSVDLENVKERAKKLELLKTIFSGIQKNNRERESLSKDIELKEVAIVCLTQKFKETLEQAGVCPICKQNICKEH